MINKPIITNRDLKEKKQQSQPKTPKNEASFLQNRVEFKNTLSSANLNVKQPNSRIIKHYSSNNPSSLENSKSENPILNDVAKYPESPCIEPRVMLRRRSTNFASVNSNRCSVPLQVNTSSIHTSVADSLQSTQCSFKVASCEKQNNKSICLNKELSTGKTPAFNLFNFTPEGLAKPSSQKAGSEPRFHRKTISTPDSMLKAIRIATNNHNNTSTLQDSNIPNHLVTRNKVFKSKGSITNDQQLTDECILLESNHNSSTLKNSKTIVRLANAKEKALQYNDQIIRQYQFNQDDEEEEANFQELCALISNKQ